MSLTLSDIAVPSLLGGLAGLNSFCQKAVAHAEREGITAETLLGARLCADMFSFTQQIQAATDTARRSIDRLAGKEPSSVTDDETSFAALIDRIEATSTHVKTADRAAVDASETRAFSVNLGQVTMEFTGRSYLMTFTLPNFLFHATTAYDILRAQGVALGKRDFLAPFITLGR